MPPKGARRKPGFNKTGRSAWREEYIDIAKNLVKNHNMSDADIAFNLGVSPHTFKKWKSEVPKLARALVRGEEQMVKTIEKSMFDRATGYSHPDEKIFIHKGRVVRAKSETYLPPDVAAAKLLLPAMKPEKYRERLELAGNPDRPVAFIIEGLEDQVAKETKRGKRQREDTAAADR